MTYNLQVRIEIVGLCYKNINIARAVVIVFNETYAATYTYVIDLKQNFTSMRSVATKNITNRTS